MIDQRRKQVQAHREEFLLVEHLYPYWKKRIDGKTKKREREITYPFLLDTGGGGFPLTTPGLAAPRLLEGTFDSDTSGVDSPVGISDSTADNLAISLARSARKSLE